MKFLFNPAVALINKLKYSQKFLLIGAIVFLTVFMLTYQIINPLIKTKDFSAKELLGIKFNTRLYIIFDEALRFQHMKHARLIGPILKDEQAKIIDKLNQDFALTDALAKKLDPMLDIKEPWTKIKQAWEQTKDPNRYQQITTNITSLIVKVCDNSNLTLDSEIESSYLSDIFCKQMPTITKEIINAKIIGLTAITSKDLPTAERDKLHVAMTLLNNQKHTLQEDLHTIFLSNISLVAALSPSLKTFSSKVRNIESVNDSLLSNNPHPSPDQFLTQYSDFIDIVSEFRENIASELTRLIQSRIENFSKTIHMNLTVVIIGLLLFSYLFSGVYLSIISNIYQLIRSSQEISKGNLDVKVQLETHDELSQVGHSFNMMRESLEQLVKNIKIATEAVRRESEEIALGNSDLAKRTIQQVTTLEETSGAMGKIADTVKQNSENAKGSYIHAQSATDIAYRGRTVVKKMVDMMNAINASAHQITDIIDVIDNIAFQTNILALNAAVEAARAGEQGRGFSVVSAEIRNLSKRSSEAAHGIKTLINNSVEQIQEGTKLGDQTLFTMEEIIKSVNNVTTIMSEIANASIEQSAGIQQINIAISEMDKVTQQNSALVEEAARAAHTLEKEAIHMNDLLDIFKTSRHKNKNLHKGPRREDPKRHEKPSLIQKLTSNNTTAPTTSSSQNDEWKEF